MRGGRQTLASTGVTRQRATNDFALYKRKEGPKPFFSESFLPELTQLNQSSG